MSDTAVRIPFSSWILATRPKTLVAGAVPVLVGAAAAADGERLWLTPFCLFCSLLIQIGTNLFNDVYDFERGADNAERLGPVRVTQAGLIPPRVVKGAAIACFVGAAVCGLVVVVNAGVILAVVGAVCLLCGWLYTGGPWPLAYHGLGEVFGVLSRGAANACESPVYTRVDSFNGWIREQAAYAAELSGIAAPAWVTPPQARPARVAAGHRADPGGGVCGWVRVRQCDGRVSGAQAGAGECGGADLLPAGAGHCEAAAGAGPRVDDV
jgi:hypothetical protein